MLVIRIVVLLVAVLYTQLICATEERSDTRNFAWQEATEYLEAEASSLSAEDAKLHKLILSIRKERAARGGINVRTYKRLNRLLAGKTPAEVELIQRALVVGTPFEKMVPEPVGEIEEIVVRWQPFTYLPSDPEEFSVGDIRQMRGIRRIANQWYREGDYAKAYPILLELAKRGFKDSQSRLAYILFNGAGGVKKSNLRALGWLGASAHGRTEPAFKVLYSKYLRQVPDEYRVTVDRVVAEYQSAFSHSEHLNCSTDHRYARGVVKRVYCRFKLEAIAEACESGPGGGNCWVHEVNVRDEI